MSLGSIGIACTVAAVLAAAAPIAALAQDNGRIMQRGDYDRSGSSHRDGDTRHALPDRTNAIPRQSIRIWPKSGAPGSDVSVSGWGFAPGAQVSVLVGNSPTRLNSTGSSTADAQGQVRASVQVPGWARPGTEVYVSIQASGQRTGVVGGPFYVTGP